MVSIKQKANSAAGADKFQLPPQTDRTTRCVTPFVLYTTVDAKCDKLQRRLSVELSCQHLRRSTYRG